MKNLNQIIKLNFISFFFLFFASSGTQAQVRHIDIDWVSSSFEFDDPNTFFISSEARLSLTYEINDNFRLKGYIGSISESALSEILKILFSFGNDVGKFSGNSLGLEAQYTLYDGNRFVIYPTVGLTEYKINYEVNSQTTNLSQTRASLGLNSFFSISDQVNLNLAFGKEFEIGGKDSSNLLSFGIGFNL